MKSMILYLLYHIVYHFHTIYRGTKYFAGVVSMSILFGTTSMLAVTITFERKSRSFERLLLAPLDLNLLMLAKTTGAIIFGVLNAFVPIFFALFITDLSAVNWFPALGSILLMAVTSTFLGLFIAVSSLGAGKSVLL